MLKVNDTVKLLHAMREKRQDEPFMAGYYMKAMMFLIETKEISRLTREYFKKKGFKPRQKLTEKDKEEFINYLTEEVDKTAKRLYTRDKIMKGETK
jgi:hypothetical protein